MIRMMPELELVESLLVTDVCAFSALVGVATLPKRLNVVKEDLRFQSNKESSFGLFTDIILRSLPMDSTSSDLPLILFCQIALT